MYNEYQEQNIPFRDLSLINKNIIVSILIKHEIIDDWLWSQIEQQANDNNTTKQKQVFSKWLKAKGYNVINFIQQRQLNQRSVPSYNKMIYDIVLETKNINGNDEEIFDDERIKYFVQSYWKKIAREMGDYIGLFFHSDYFNTDDLCNIRDGVYFHQSQIPGMEFQDDLQTSADLNRDLIFDGNNTVFPDITPDQLPDEDTYLQEPDEDTMDKLDEILEKKYGYLEKYYKLIEDKYTYINENGKREREEERLQEIYNDKPHYYISLLKELTFQYVWPDIDDMITHHDYPIIGGKKSKRKTNKKYKRKKTNKKKKNNKRKTIRK